MKRLLIGGGILGVLVACVVAYATYQVNVYIEQGGDKMVAASGGEIEMQSGATLDVQSGVTVSESRYQADGESLMKRLVRSTYDASVDGGTSGATYDLGEDLPANAIVHHNYFQVVEQFVDDASGTVMIKCASNDDLFAAADISGDAAGTLKDGVADGTATNMFDVGASACNLQVVLGPANVSAGKLVHWVEYVISE